METQDILNEVGLTLTEVLDAGCFECGGPVVIEGTCVRCLDCGYEEVLARDAQQHRIAELIPNPPSLADKIPAV